MIPKYFTFLRSAIEACAAKSGTDMSELSSQDIQIIYAVMEAKGRVRCCDSFIIEEEPGLYRVS